MSFLRNITSGLRSLFQKEQVDRELDEELRAYQEMATEEKLKQGMNPTLPFALRAWSEEASGFARRSFALASRGVRAGSPWSSSMNRSTDAKSPVSWNTYPERAYGLITSSGTRGPSP